MNITKFLFIVLVTSFILTGCMLSPSPKRDIPEGYEVEMVEKGDASWYGPGFHGNTTANGERYDMYNLTAAHKELPFNTLVKVTNLNNNESVIVRINDRGPYIDGRIIDLSKSSFNAISQISVGVIPVKLEILKETKEEKK